MMREELFKLAEEAGFVRIKACCDGVPFKVCSTDEWRGDLGAFAAKIESNALAARSMQAGSVGEDVHGDIVRHAISRLDATYYAQWKKQPVGFASGNVSIGDLVIIVEAYRVLLSRYGAKDEQQNPVDKT